MPTRSEWLEEQERLKGGVKTMHINDDKTQILQGRK